VNLTTIQTDVAQFEHTAHLCQKQDADKQLLDLRQEGLTKVGNGIVIWVQPTGNEPKRNALISGPLDFARAEHTGGVSVEQ
jgi:hypothetical protein